MFLFMLSYVLLLIFARTLYQRRVDARNKKGGEEGAKDDKLLKLQQLVDDVADKRKTQQAELSGLEEEFKKTMFKLANIEAKQRKTFLMSKDYASLGT